MPTETKSIDSLVLTESESTRFWSKVSCRADAEKDLLSAQVAIVSLREEITFLITGVSELHERFKGDTQLELLAALCSQLQEIKSTLKTFSEQKLTTEMSEEDYEQSDVDFAYDKFIEESRMLLARLSPSGTTSVPSTEKNQTSSSYLANAPHDHDHL